MLRTAAAGLKNLTELALVEGVWFTNSCTECEFHPVPTISPKVLRAAFDILLSLPQLTSLRLSAASTFLDTMNLEWYTTTANGLPSLEKLQLGHGDLIRESRIGGTSHESVPLRHLAAFCSMLPNLVDVGIPNVNAMALEKESRAEWACFGVKSRVINHWALRDKGYGTLMGTSRELLQLSLKTYFPNSSFAKQDSDPPLPMVDRA